MSSRSLVTKFTPAFKAVIEESARKIFGNLPVVNYRTGNKFLKRKPLGPIAINYYPADPERPFRNIVKDFATDVEMRRADSLYRLKRRGKGPPKKGHGKRASKKK